MVTGWLRVPNRLLSPTLFPPPEFVAMLRGKDSELRRLATLRFKAAPITY